ncbi:bifunctional 3-(3-hydroxy-phenyl)propionate/3-hydroxycinnamic acid hydroxylase [Mycobacterium sp.]|uniref:bifunctional 3-(3-hydroxy-phenyl)propionate/3-hydroxycinnamic acid hydroxylase n=1 Tax=Mycobacterium sp. TaxID=1785 RepID=UPI002BB086D0|nr:bifunctional 3-(3-hydroxy-phenyl)propionate/3-hydroxycinnamic acid hydroxylase [Mycobacterium sp.]HKP40905.1 bifunctional 3-(3-hydroxy-phenyl)propionate/3-hydroxycinnamic acid hydroxylase [Mycobacterium sp.]
MTVEPFDVAIIGYGPTGLALAYWLGKAGHKTVVIERWSDLYELPRAGHVDGEVMRLFQRMGIADPIAADSSITGHTVILDADGVQMAKVEAEPSEQGWWSHYSLYQPNLERMLDTNVRSTGNVTVRQGWQADNIEEDADGQYRVGISFGESHDGQWVATGERQVLKTRWLIGADGANSVVGRHLNGSVQDLGYKARDLVIFADRLDPAVGATMPDSEVGMMLPRPYCAWRESGKRFARWEFAVHDDETSAEMSTETKAWELIAPWGFTPENSRLIRHTVFEFETLVFDQWRCGNIVLAGDAAHRMPPFQGQGMCSGQRDAAALAWRLDLVLRGIAGAAILDSYTDERKPQVLELMKIASERAQIYWSTDPDVMRERDARMREGLVATNLKNGYGTVPPLSDGFLMRIGGEVVSPAGQLSAQFTVTRSGRESLLDNHVGANWLLLSVDQSLVASLRAADRHVLKQLNATEVVLGADPSQDGFEDVGGNYARWLNDLGCRLVLVRPDCYIFGGAADADGVRSLFDSLREQLHLKVVAA